MFRTGWIDRCWFDRLYLETDSWVDQLYLETDLNFFQLLGSGQKLLFQVHIQGVPPKKRSLRYIDVHLLVMLHRFRKCLKNQTIIRAAVSQRMLFWDTLYDSYLLTVGPVKLWNKKTTARLKI